MGIRLGTGVNSAGSGGGGGSGTVGPGTTGNIAKFTAATTVGDSIITESGSVITIPGTLTITQGTIVADAPHINTTVTWNNAGIAGPAWKLNVTDTSSTATALLLELQVGGTPKVNITKAGSVRIGSGGSFSVTEFGAAITGDRSFLVFDSGSGAVVGIGGVLQFVANGTDAASGDLKLNRDAARVHAWRDGTSANTGRIYNTFTSSTNYERFSVDWTTTANVCFVGTEKGSGGGTARDMVLMTDATERMRIAAGGEITVKSLTATPAGGSTAARLVFGTTAGFGVYYGSGAPTVSAAQGSLYLRSDGSSTSTRSYINTDGGTTWTNHVTAA